MPNIFITVFNCSPIMGSEHSMGWNTIINIAKKTPITVVTRCEFSSIIRQRLEENNNIKLVFVKELSLKRYIRFIPAMIEFYIVYPIWEYKVYKLLLKINQNTPIDIVHKLNIIGIKEPGFSWKIPNTSFFIGPLGGFEYINLKYFSLLRFREKALAVLNNISVYITRYKSSRIEKCLVSSSMIYTINSFHKDFIINRFKSKNIKVFSDSFPFVKQVQIKPRKSEETLRLVTACRLEAIKGVQLAISAISKLRKDIKYKFTIIGQGKYEPILRQRLEELNICYEIKPWVDRTELFEILNASHLFIYSSFKDASTHIIPESISCGCPILCLNHLGYGDLVSADIGIKIDTNGSLDTIIRLFKESIEFLYDNESQRYELAKNCVKFSSENSWEMFAEQVYHDYTEQIRIK